MSISRLLRVAAVALLCGPLFCFALDPEAIVVVLSEEGGAYMEVADALKDGLERDGKGRFRVNVITAGRQPISETVARADAKAVVTVGMKAATSAQQAGVGVPVLFTLIPKVAVDRFVGNKQIATPRAGIYLDQPPERQLELIKLVLPGATRVGVIYGPDSALSASALEAAAAALSMKLESETVANSSEVPMALQRVLERSEVTLALPDPEVFNRNTVHNFFLSAYRAGDAVFAFSPAYVKAGALAGVYSSPAQIGAQAAELILRLPNRAAWAEVRYPKYFSVTVNRTVARSMGITIEQDGDLQSKMHSQAALDQ